MNGSGLRPSLNGSQETGSNHVQRDLERFNKAFERAGAVRTDANGFKWLDESVLPGPMVQAYRRLLLHGYANGLL